MGYTERDKGKTLFENWQGKAGKGNLVFSAGGNISVDSVLAGNAAAAGTQTIKTVAIPANTLDRTGRGLYIQAFGTLGQSAANKTLVFTVGGKTLTATSTFTGSAWELDCTLFKSGANQQTLLMEGWLGSTRISHQVFTDTSVDTGVINITIGAISGSSSGSDVLVNSLYAEWMG